MDRVQQSFVATGSPVESQISIWTAGFVFFSFVCPIVLVFEGMVAVGGGLVGPAVGDHGFTFVFVAAFGFGHELLEVSAWGLVSFQFINDILLQVAFGDFIFERLV